MMPRRPRLVRPARKDSEVRQLLRRATPQEAAIILLLLDTGLRASEFCRLDVADIDLSSGVVRVQSAKAGAERLAYLGAKSRRALFRYWGEMGIESGAAVLTQRGRRRLSPNVLFRTLERRSRATGIEATPHTLRRTCAVLNLRAGVDIYTLARLMGHESIETLRQYLPLVDGDIQAAHQRAGVVDRL